jgi:hypothetical protein
MDERRQTRLVQKKYVDIYIYMTEPTNHDSVFVSKNAKLCCQQHLAPHTHTLLCLLPISKRTQTTDRADE